MIRDAMGYILVKNIDELKAAIEIEKAVLVSVKCPCCKRNVIVDEDKARFIINYNDSFVN